MLTAWTLPDSRSWLSLPIQSVSHSILGNDFDGFSLVHYFSYYSQQEMIYYYWDDKKVVLIVAALHLRAYLIKNCLCRRNRTTPSCPPAAFHSSFSASLCGSLLFWQRYALALFKPERLNGIATVTFVLCISRCISVSVFTFSLKIRFRRWQLDHFRHSRYCPRHTMKMICSCNWIIQVGLCVCMFCSTGREPDFSQRSVQFL